MFKKFSITLAGIVSLLTVLYFLEVNGSARNNDQGSQISATEEIVKFSIKPVKLRMFPGGSMQLIATGYNNRGQKVMITPKWSLKSDISELGEFDKQKGEKVVFSALNSGSGSIVAVYENLEAEVQVKVFRFKK